MMSPSLKQVGELLHGRIEVAVPAVAIDAVVRRAEGVDGLVRPRLVGHAVPAGRPRERTRPRGGRPVGALTARCSSTNAATSWER